MQLKQILKTGQEKLKDVSQTSSLDTEVLASHILGLSRTDLILKDDLELNREEEKQFLELVKRRINNEPIAYLVNEKEFYGHKFYVNEDVLIPRPETEVLVENVIKLVEREKSKVKSEKKDDCAEYDFLMVDVGTGSGCIPVALAQSLEIIDFIAIDISEKALRVAQENVEKYDLGERIKLREGDLLEDFTSILKMVEDNVIITANLPYVENEAELGSEVKDYEPHLALFAGEDGLDLYRRLLEQVQLIEPLAVFLEIDPKQVKPLKKLSKKLLPEYKIEIKKDLAGKERVFVLKRK